MLTENRDVAGLSDVIRATGRLAVQARALVNSAGGVLEREGAMLATVAEDVRDRAIAAARLKEAREDELLAGFRRTAHRAVDIGFDLAATVITVAWDVIDGFLNAPRTDDAVRTTTAS